MLTNRRKLVRGLIVVTRSVDQCLLDHLVSYEEGVHSDMAFANLKL